MPSFRRCEKQKGNLLVMVVFRLEADAVQLLELRLQNGFL